jgi:hypothetical protein
MTAVCAWIVLAETSGNVSPLDNSFSGERNGCQLSGLVTVNGRPISHGQIRFTCQLTPIEYSNASEGTNPVSVPIIDGEYFVAQTNRLEPGWYLVQILTSEVPSPLADPYPLPVWCDSAQKTVRFKVGRRLMMQIAETAVGGSPFPSGHAARTANVGVAETNLQTVDFELETEGQPSYQDIH